MVIFSQKADCSKRCQHGEEGTDYQGIRDAVEDSVVENTKLVVSTTELAVSTTELTVSNSEDASRAQESRRSGTQGPKLGTARSGDPVPDDLGRGPISALYISDSTVFSLLFDLISKKIISSSHVHRLKIRRK